MKLRIKSLSDTEKLAKNFAECLNEKGLFVTLTGDIGAGKTQFIRYVLKYLDVKDKITSPSFVILNEYKCSMFPVYHFDLYRLEQKGLKSIIEELREYSKIGKLTFIEWAEFAHNEIPCNALKINIEYDEAFDDGRWFDFNSNDEYANEFIEKLKGKIENEQ